MLHGGVIESEFLASLRRRLRPELVITMVQLEQLCPGWWESLTELAEQLGTDRASLNRSVRQLEDHGLIRRCSISNRSGTWIWWVKRHEADAPRLEVEPAWVVFDEVSKRSARITVSDRWSWADRKGIPRQTMRSFLAGNQAVLRERWRLVSTPLDCEGL